MAHPELPYAAVGLVAVAAGTAKTGKVPDLTVPAIGTIVLVIITSASAGTRYESLVTAIGHLLLLSVILSAVNEVRKSATKTAKKESKK